MDPGLDKKKHDIEMDMKKIFNINTMISETKEKIKRIEEEHKKQKNQHQRELTNTYKVQFRQETRLAKVDQDVKHLTSLCESRREELNNLIKFNAELKAELMKAQDEAGNSKEKLEQLENDIKRAYKELQNEKEIQVLLEVGLSDVKDNDQLPLRALKEILMKRQECVNKRQEEINQEINKVEEEQVALEEEIKKHKSRFASLKSTHLDLLDLYKNSKNSKNCAKNK